MSPRALVATGGLVAVAAALILGFLQLGPPSLNRARTADQQLVDAMQRLPEELHSGYERLPATLPEAMDAGDQKLRDEVAYRRLGSGYELCAAFLTNDIDAGDRSEFASWQHPAAPYCFYFSARSYRPNRGYAIGVVELSERLHATRARFQ